MRIIKRHVVIINKFVTNFLCNCSYRDVTLRDISFGINLWLEDLLFHEATRCTTLRCSPTRCRLDEHGAGVSCGEGKTTRFESEHHGASGQHERWRSRWPSGWYRARRRPEWLSLINQEFIHCWPIGPAFLLGIS